jgi:hypothetical protein
LALLEGALLVACQPTRRKAVPLTVAEQFEPGTVVVVVAVVVVAVGFVVVVVARAVVVVVAAATAEAGAIVGTRNIAVTASVAVKAVQAKARRPSR